MIRAEYIWLDGTKPTKRLRSKVRYLPETKGLDVPEWGFDGSSTGQSSGHKSDLILKPVKVVKDPINYGSSLVLCEVYNQDGSVHESNTRHQLALLNEYDTNEVYLGFEQEYVFMKNGKPLGFPAEGYPAPQGPYYCGNGASNAPGRHIVEEHAEACQGAGLNLYGTNSEVLLGQWEFQIGYRGTPVNALQIADELWLARFLLERIAENYDVDVSYDCKPIKGDWNGSGCHTNFSTKGMRADGGITQIHEAISKLSRKHTEHIAVYGHGLGERLTGQHETCSINEFRSGDTDRGCSIRIPLGVTQSGKGYLEDRRPGANCDPYEVAARLITTICGEE